MYPIYHISELLTEVLYDLVLQGVSKIREVKVENIYIYLIKVKLSTLICLVFDTPLGTGLYSASFENSEIMQNIMQQGLVMVAQLASVKTS